MTIRVGINHRTEYLFDRPVELTPHVVRLRPAPHTRTPLHRSPSSGCRQRRQHPLCKRHCRIRLSNTHRR